MCHPRKHLESHLLLAAAAGALVLGACSRDPVTTVPGHLDPGPTLHVAEQVLGGNGAGGRGDRATLGTTPYIPWTAPNLPIVTDGEVDVLVFTPQESRSGLALRERHFVYVRVREQSFTTSWRHHYKTLVTDQALGGPRAAARPASSLLRPQREPSAALSPQPFIPGGREQVQVTVAEVQPDGSKLRLLGKETLTTPGGAGMEQQLQRSAEDYVQRLIRETEGRAAPTHGPSIGAPAVERAP
jgi:hypothetical protein